MTTKFLLKAHYCTKNTYVVNVPQIHHSYLYTLLTHLHPMFHFYTPWKYQKTSMFSRDKKWNIGWKWVNFEVYTLHEKSSFRYIMSKIALHKWFPIFALYFDITSLETWRSLTIMKITTSLKVLCSSIFVLS